MKSIGMISPRMVTVIRMWRANEKKDIFYLWLDESDDPDA